MIRGVIIINDQGKPRLIKFYDYQPIEKQHDIIRNIYTVLCNRAENVSNFVQADSTFGPDTRLVYKTFATLYFIVIFDESENELAILDLMQVFVETLDKCFSNVCELDIVFNFSKVHTILNEIILGGQVVEMSSAEVVKAVDEISWSHFSFPLFPFLSHTQTHTNTRLTDSRLHVLCRQEKNKFSHSSSNATSGWQRR
ncbi:Adaptor protein complex, sigma subunit [Artemisia annua]|uniref:Adaptor protein complex, sigma subunit n=1 Tax=Artemisia annua TaxID=35608 RepID=A0A2U1P1S6_ARTAN|nr:Adaptor protein complex, sigma subunit [Artemisia annua]